MKETIKKLYVILGNNYKKKTFFIFLGVIAIAVFEVLSIAIVLPFMKLVLDVHNATEITYLQSIKQYITLDNNQFIIAFGLFVIFLFLIKNSLHYLIHKYHLKELHHIRSKLSQKMFKTYIYMDYSEFVGRNIASLIHNSTGQVNSFVLIYLQSLLFLISELVVVLALALLLFIVNFKVMFSLTIGVSILGLLIIKLTKKKLLAAGTQQNEAVVRMYKDINEGISGLKEVKVLQVEGYFIERFNQASKWYQQAAIVASKIQVLPKLILEVVFITGLVTIVLVAEWLSLDLKALVPTLILFSMAFFKIFPSVNRMISFNNALLTSKVSFDTLYEEVSCQQEIVCSHEVKQDISWKFERSISLENISFSYVVGEPVFSELSLNIPKNATVAFVGRSGSGKTTLIDLILGIIKPEVGKVMVDDYDINMNLSAWHSKVGYIPQTIAFIDGSIRENIALGTSDINESTLEKSIIDAQLEEFISSLPEGLDTQIGDKGVRLSGGQKQRIGIARALYRNPDILIFDEATSALDVETERALTESISNLGGSKTIIIVAHRISTVKDSDIIYVLENGEIKDHGKYESLLVQNKWFQEINK